MTAFCFLRAVCLAAWLAWAGCAAAASAQWGARSPAYARRALWPPLATLGGGTPASTLSVGFELPAEGYNALARGDVLLWRLPAPLGARTGDSCVVRLNTTLLADATSHADVAGGWVYVRAEVPSSHDEAAPVFGTLALVCALAPNVVTPTHLVDSQPLHLRAATTAAQTLVADAPYPAALLAAAAAGASMPLGLQLVGAPLAGAHMLPGFIAALLEHVSVTRPRTFAGATASITLNATTAAALPLPRLLTAHVALPDIARWRAAQVAPETPMSCSIAHAPTATCTALFVLAPPAAATGPALQADTLRVDVDFGSSTPAPLPAGGVFSVLVHAVRTPATLTVARVFDSDAEFGIATPDPASVTAAETFALSVSLRPRGAVSSLAFGIQRQVPLASIFTAANELAADASLTLATRAQGETAMAIVGTLVVRPPPTLVQVPPPRFASPLWTASRTMRMDVLLVTALPTFLLRHMACTLAPATGDSPAPITVPVTVTGKAGSAPQFLFAFPAGADAEAFAEGFKVQCEGAIDGIVLVLPMRGAHVMLVDADTGNVGVLPSVPVNFVPSFALGSASESSFKITANCYDAEAGKNCYDADAMAGVWRSASIRAANMPTVTPTPSWRVNLYARVQPFPTHVALLEGAPVGVFPAGASIAADLPAVSWAPCGIDFSYASYPGSFYNLTAGVDYTAPTSGTVSADGRMRLVFTFLRDVELAAPLPMNATLTMHLVCANWSLPELGVSPTTVPVPLGADPSQFDTTPRAVAATSQQSATFLIMVQQRLIASLLTLPTGPWVATNGATELASPSMSLAPWQAKDADDRTPPAQTPTGAAIDESAREAGVEQPANAAESVAGALREAVAEALVSPSSIWPSSPVTLRLRLPLTHTKLAAQTRLLLRLPPGYAAGYVDTAPTLTCTHVTTRTAVPLQWAVEPGTTRLLLAVSASAAELSAAAGYSLLCTGLISAPAPTALDYGLPSMTLYVAPGVGPAAPVVVPGEGVSYLFSVTVPRVVARPALSFGGSTASLSVDPVLPGRKNAITVQVGPIPFISAVVAYTVIDVYFPWATSPHAGFGTCEPALLSDAVYKDARVNVLHTFPIELTHATGFAQQASSAIRIVSSVGLVSASMLTLHCDIAAPLETVLAGTPLEVVAWRNITATELVDLERVVIPLRDRMSAAMPHATIHFAPTFDSDTDATGALPAGAPASVHIDFPWTMSNVLGDTVASVLLPPGVRAASPGTFPPSCSVAMYTDSFGRDRPPYLPPASMTSSSAWANATAETWGVTGYYLVDGRVYTRVRSHGLMAPAPWYAMLREDAAHPDWVTAIQVQLPPTTNAMRFSARINCTGLTLPEGDAYRAYPVLPVSVITASLAIAEPDVASPRVSSQALVLTPPFAALITPRILVSPSRAALRNVATVAHVLAAPLQTRAVAQAQVVLDTSTKSSYRALFNASPVAVVDGDPWSMVEFWFPMQPYTIVPGGTTIVLTAPREMSFANAVCTLVSHAPDLTLWPSERATTTHTVVALRFPQTMQSVVLDTALLRCTQVMLPRHRFHVRDDYVLQLNDLDSGDAYNVYSVRYTIPHYDIVQTYISVVPPIAFVPTTLSVTVLTTAHLHAGDAVLLTLPNSHSHSTALSEVDCSVNGVPVTASISPYPDQVLSVPFPKALAPKASRFASNSRAHYHDYELLSVSVSCGVMFAYFAEMTATTLMFVVGGHRSFPLAVTEQATMPALTPLIFAASDAELTVATGTLLGQPAPRFPYNMTSTFVMRLPESVSVADPACTVNIDGVTFTPAVTAHSQHSITLAMLPADTNPVSAGGKLLTLVCSGLSASPDATSYEEGWVDIFASAYGPTQPMTEGSFIIIV